MINRRQFLSLMSASLFSKAVNTTEKQAIKNPSTTNHHIHKTLYLSAGANLLGHYYLSALNNHGEVLFSNPLPTRGHGFAIDYTNQQIFCISRRPENTIDVLRFDGSSVAQIPCSEGRHLYGHATCSNDNCLYIPENKWQTGQGVITVRNAQSNTYDILQEFPSYGAGPHEVTLSTDQNYMIVANGGIKTRPDTGRKKLNLDSMHSSLTFIERSTGKLMRHVYLPEQQRYNSIRHLTVSKEGIVFAALQNQLKTKTNEVLLIKHDFIRNTTSKLHIPSALQKKLNGYIGSIALDKSQHIIAATCPKGGYILFYHYSGKLLGYSAMQDVCGVARGNTNGVFMVTSGGGIVRRYLVQVETKKISYSDLAHYPETRWDNHLLRV